MSLGKYWQTFKARATSFARNRRGNTAMIFALTLVPVTLAAGAGVDLTRALVVRSRLAEALDAAGLAVGATQGLTTAQIQQLAQNYFSANYTADASYGTPASITVTPGTDQVQLSTSVSMPTVLIRVADILPGNSGKFDNISVGYTSTVVWGQTKLWVSLVLDNTGSMTQTDSTGTSKLSALQTATTQLLSTLKSASATAGDVMVSIVPFSKDVNVGMANESAGWIDWTDWESAPSNGTPSSSVGPGSSCPYSNFSNGYTCKANPTNGSSSVSKIPSSGTYSGYVCPSVDSGNVNSGRLGRYYNGCYNSVASTKTVSTGRNASCTGYSNCTCSGSGSNKVCTQNNGYTHTWIANSHDSWGGCVMDRAQSYDIAPTAPTGTATDFPAENSQSCVPTTMLGQLSDDWTALNNEVSSMTAGGSTNQPIGLAWGWQAQTNNSPLSSGTLPANTSQYIILVSDGLNTQDRWYGDGSDESTQVDARMNSLCTSAKATGIVIYTIYVDLNGTQGNSTVLQNCATDSTKYFDLTTSGSIISTLNNIAQQITQLRVSH